MFLNKIIDKISFKINPVRFARKKGAKVGNGCIFSRHIALGSEPFLLEFGDNVQLTNGVCFVNHDGGLGVVRKLKGGEFALDHIHSFKKIIIGNNVFIGINTIILPGVHIGDNSIVGAGSVVTKDIPSNSVACGNPAKIIKSIDEYASKKFEENLDWNHDNYKKNQRKEIERVLNQEIL